MKTLLSKSEQSTLHDALHYMKMAELRKALLLLTLPDKGKKSELIKRIMTFIETGNVEKIIKIPVQSRVKNHPRQPIAAKSLMLYGSYKNDLKTRIFFKELIGPHFHFTAYGIDWLNERWLKGNPPTYQEFANYWVEETNKRKKTKPKPKDEWMYIRFMQHMEKIKPHASKDELMQSWKKLQAQKSKDAFILLKKIIEA